MTDDSLEEKHRRMCASQAKLMDIIKVGSYRTEEGFVAKMPDLNDPEVFDLHMKLMLDAQAYFAAASHLKWMTTYNFKKERPT